MYVYKEAVKHMNVVSVMAHQDDELMCLGTMIKMKNAGYGNNSIAEAVHRSANAVGRKFIYVAKDPKWNQLLAEHLRRGDKNEKQGQT
jgi:hypothetical protein